MNDKASFPYKIDFEGKEYAGMITPSGDTGSNGTPTYFRVTIGDEFFAYLCCGETGWGLKDGPDTGQEGLVKKIGQFIHAKYE